MVKAMYRCKFYLIFLVVLTVPYSAASAEEVLTWQDCIKEAALNHPDLIAAQDVVKESEASKRITASTLFPQITSDVSASRSKAAVTGGGGGNFPAQTTNSFSYEVTGSQLIFDGFKTVNNVKASQETIKASQQSYRYTSSQVRLRLRTAFANLLYAQQLGLVTEDIVKIRKDNLGLIKLRYQSGLEHEGALLTAEANLAQAEFQAAQAQRDVGLVQRQLTKEMGRTEFVPMTSKGDFTVINAEEQMPDFEALAKDNPSLLQLVAQKNAAAFSLKSTYGNFFPSLSVSGGAGKTGDHWAPSNNEWDAGLTVSFPLFEGGERLAQVDQAKATLNQLGENERSEKDSVVVTLQQEWVSLQDAIGTVDVQKKQLAAAQERSEIANVEFSTGFMNYDNWTIIEDNLVQAKTGYLSAQVNALLAEANWIAAKGEKLEYVQ